MTREEFSRISKAADSLGIINRAIATLQNEDQLYIVTDYSLHVRLVPGDAITIPRELLDEFKQKLLAHYTKRYNKIINDLKPIDDESGTDKSNV